jgi:hypothetical protein
MTVDGDSKRKPKAAFYEVETKLKTMVNRPDGIRVSDAVKKAEANVQSYKATGVASMDEKIAQLVEICERMRSGVTEADERKVYLLSNDIFDAAGMFGEPELSEAAYSLCEMIGNRADRVPLSWDAVNVHISTMRLLRQSASDADPAGRHAVLQGLRKVTARMLAETAAEE